MRKSQGGVPGARLYHSDDDAENIALEMTTLVRMQRRAAKVRISSMMALPTRVGGDLRMEGRRHELSFPDGDDDFFDPLRFLGL